MKAFATHKTGFDVLVDYVIRIAAAKPWLAQKAVKEQNIGLLVAAALEEMSAAVHAPDEQATYNYRALKFEEEDTYFDENNEVPA